MGNLIKTKNIKKTFSRIFAWIAFQLAISHSIQKPIGAYVSGRSGGGGGGGVFWYGVGYLTKQEEAKAARVRLMALFGMGDTGACMSPATCVLLTTVLFLLSHVTIPKAAITASYKNKDAQKLVN